VQLTPEEREEKIRPLATAGLSTRAIEKQTGIPQSTVVRDLKRINTGESPIQLPEQNRTTQRLRWTVRAGALFVTSLLILAVVLGAATLLRDIPARQPVYNPIFNAPTRPAAASQVFYICAGITIEGYLTDLVQATDRKCPKGWKMLVLHSG
jgi:hypothetical protein